MKIKDEILSFKAMSKGKKRILVLFLASVLFWWGMMNFAPTSPFTFWSFIPLLTALLYSGYVFPAPKKDEKNVHKEQEGQE